MHWSAAEWVAQAVLVQQVALLLKTFLYEFRRPLASMKATVCRWSHHLSVRLSWNLAQRRWPRLIVTQKPLNLWWKRSLTGSRAWGDTSNGSRTPLQGVSWDPEHDVDNILWVECLNHASKWGKYGGIASTTQLHPNPQNSQKPRAARNKLNMLTEISTGANLTSDD